MTFTLNPNLDLNALAQTFSARGRVQVEDFLALEDAERLHDSLVREQQWRLTFNVGQKVFEFSPEELNALEPARRKLLDLQVTGGARSGFQYRYHSLRIPDGQAARGAAPDLRNQLAAWLSEGAGRRFLRTVTGVSDFNFVDGQVTAYKPGDFLTVHDDAAPRTSRRAAYVLNLTKDWRPDWGGLLIFHDAHELAAWPPSFNTLNLFRIPQPHSVSAVVSSAPRPRYSISGWLRSGPRPP